LPAGIAELMLPRDARALARIATEDNLTGALGRRREVLGEVAKQLLMGPPPDPFVPELFDFLTAMAPRMQSGVVSPAWGSYLYTEYQRNLVRERPTGLPRRSAPEVQQSLDRSIQFFHLEAREGRKVRTVEDAATEDTIEWRNERRMGR
jgi:hypothetical protein